MDIRGFEWLHCWLFSRNSRLILPALPAIPALSCLDEELMHEMYIDKGLYSWASKEISSVESQKGVNAVQRCSVENKKGAVAL